MVNEVITGAVNHLASGVKQQVATGMGWVFNKLTLAMRYPQLHESPGAKPINWPLGVYEYRADIASWNWDHL